MSKSLTLVALLLGLGTCAFAQTNTYAGDTLNTDGSDFTFSESQLDDDNADFTFTESQLDDDNDASQTVSSLLSAASDPFLSEVGYRFSPMRFKVRAYDNMYEQTYLNGLMMNDLEQGRFSFGLIGGMNDATRNQEGVAGFEHNNFSFAGIGGATNINVRASQFAAGNKITLSGTNRNYVLRGMYTYATGIMENGWAFAGTIGYRWAKEGVIEGTFYNSLSYLLSAEKKINDQHSISLVTFGSPTERAQQGASTEEAYWLANSHYYNPYWGYQDGKKRNSRVVRDYSPTAIATWDWVPDQYKKLTTSVGVKYSMYSTTALGWNGDAYDPRPDYYKNLPSSVFDVYDLEKNNPEYLADNPYLVDQWQDLYDFWKASKANRQVNWDRMYYVNSIQNQTGDETLYYQERRHNDQLAINFNSTWNHSLDQFNKYSVGLQVNHTLGMHYKTMQDLLGGEFYYDYDKFSANDYGHGTADQPSEACNDLRNPYKRIFQGDKFGYDYNIIVDRARLWGQWNYSRGRWNILGAGYAEGTSMERDGKMQNGRAPENSYGKSGSAGFMGGGGKFVASFRPLANHRVKVGLSWDSQAPLSRNSFVAPRMQNNFVDNLTLEDIFSGELSWSFRFGNLSGKFTGYYTKFMNQVEQTAFYNDQESRFTYLTMTGIDKVHYGFEGALVYQVNSSLSFNLLASIGDAKYTDNPNAQVNYEGMNAATNAQLNKWENPVTGQAMPLRVIAKDVKVGSTPLTALSLGANYNINNWYLELDVNYYDRVYVGYSAYRRLSNIISNYTGTSNNGTVRFDVEESKLKQDGGVLFAPDGSIMKTYTPKLEKYDGGFMVDASIGRYIRLNGGKAISINLQFQNLLNNRNLRTGGFEQNRDDLYSTGVARAYKFSMNSKYYYANAFNAFLNVNYRF